MGPFYFPEIDPVALDLGILQIRWYSIAYICGFIFTWRFGMRVASKAPHILKPDHVDQFLTLAVLGVIVGGRLGHVFFYYPGYYLQNPVEILYVWEGGMAFHGGLIGAITVMYLYTRKMQLNFFWLADVIAIGAPIGLFFGRIANFINQELWGRVTDAPWAVIFPRAGPDPRHPSQLYEAAMEGLLLFLITFGAYKLLKARFRPGLISGLFLVGYCIARATGEIFREPEVLTTGLPFNTTFGQWLSLPMALYGGYLIWRAYKNPMIDDKKLPKAKTSKSKGKAKA